MRSAWSVTVLLAAMALPADAMQLTTSILPECPGDPRCPKRAEQLPPPPGDGGNPPVMAAAPGAPERMADVVPDTVYFAADRADLSVEAGAILDEQVKWLLAHPGVRIAIEGHDDDRRSREASLMLAERRANAVRDHFIARGVQPERISTISYGKERPVAIGDDAQSRARNRRVVTLAVE